jgi:ankyrin repeat protein
MGKSSSAPPEQASTIPSRVSQGVVTVEEQKIRSLQEMLQNSPDLVNNNELGMAANAGQLRVAAFLLDHGVDVNSSQNGSQPLALAVSADEKAMVEFLLSRGADANARTGNGGTALLTAVGNGSQAVVEILLAHKADVNEAFTKLTPGKTPLHVAVERGYVHLVNLLLSAGANPNVKDIQARTPLMEAVEKHSVAMVKALLEAKADPNAQDGGGTTALGLTKDSQDASSGEAAAVATITDLLRAHGGVESLPDWNHIKVLRPSTGFSTAVFSKGTNDWNHFTLLEFGYLVFVYNNGYNQTVRFPDFANLTVVRPSAGGAPAKRIDVNLLNATNSLEFGKDIPLEFGDVVEIPEREHTLAQQDDWLPREITRLVAFLKAKAGVATLVVAGGRTIQLPLTGPLNCEVNFVLTSEAARKALTISSDLARVQVTRQNPAGGKADEWTLDCRYIQQIPPPHDIIFDLWLRDGDVIAVPEK